MTGTPKQLISYLLEQEKDKLFDISEHHKKRSHNANSYMWVLIGKMGDALRLSKEEIYLQMLKDYGQSEMISVLSEINIDGYFKYYEKAGESDLKGKSFTHYKIYKGSSEYDSREMSILLDGVVKEAESVGIETLTPDELERLKTSWKGE